MLTYMYAHTHTQVPFLLNFSMELLSVLSPDHPSATPTVGGLYTASVTRDSELRKLSLQCTAVDVQGGL